jgi:hypothetical protein
MDHNRLKTALNELVYELGKVSAAEGEAWRLKHVELMDMFQSAQELLDEMAMEDL